MKVESRQGIWEGENGRQKKKRKTSFRNVQKKIKIRGNGFSHCLLPCYGELKTIVLGGSFAYLSVELSDFSSDCVIAVESCLLKKIYFILF